MSYHHFLKVIVFVLCFTTLSLQTWGQCATNPAASDAFADAPYICNLDGFCGTTQNYSIDLPANLGSASSNCPSIFGGAVDNNSWLQFEASSTSITLNVTLPTCYAGTFPIAPNGGFDGIQMGILEYDGTNFNLVSACAQTDGNASGASGSLVVSSSTLTVGNTYYIMVDGYAGSECDYVISTNSGVITLDAGADVSACSGAATNLTATGPSGSTYSWTGSDGFGPTAGASVTVFPTTATTYTVTTTSGLCNNQTDDVVVSIMACTTCSINSLTLGNQSDCNSIDNSYTQEVIVDYTNPPGSGMLTVANQDFAVTSSPQTVLLIGLDSDGNAVDVTATFTGNPTCTLTSNGLFTAPTCTTTCIPNNGTWN